MKSEKNYLSSALAKIWHLNKLLMITAFYYFATFFLKTFLKSGYPLPLQDKRRLKPTLPQSVKITFMKILEILSFLLGDSLNL